jgi:type I restriction enzyme R subunit
LPPEYPRSYTATTTTPQIKKFHLDERRARHPEEFIRFGEYPKSLLSRKAADRFDAPILAMYLDKPMRDHTLLGHRAGEPPMKTKLELAKPHGFVVDFVGIFDKWKRRSLSTAMRSTRLSKS